MSRVFFASELDTVAAYWRILRRDGIALGFTTHDRDLYFGGLVHRAAPGMLPSAVRLTADLADDEAEVEGALAHDTIREADILAGRFDRARIETGVVDWQTLDHASLYAGWIDTVSQDAGSFSAQLRSLKSALDIDPVPRTSPTCRARFCGPGCGLPPQAYEVRLAAEAIDAARNAVTFPLPEPHLFLDGTLRWIDGPQTGLVFRIIAAEDALVLDRPLDPRQAPGARAILRQGCERTIAVCAQRFGNAINFQGEPMLPGNDLLAQYPQPR